MPIHIIRTFKYLCPPEFVHAVLNYFQTPRIKILHQGKESIHDLLPT